jgi:hypothetical protein
MKSKHLREFGEFTNLKFSMLVAVWWQYSSSCRWTSVASVGRTANRVVVRRPPGARGLVVQLRLIWQRGANSVF